MTRIISSSGAVLALSFVAAAVLAGCGGSEPDQQSSAHPIAVNQLFLEDPHSGKIAAFPTASPETGTAFSSHVVATLDGASGAMAYDAEHDDLYVAVEDTATNAASVKVYANASTMTAGVPSRTITFEAGIPAFSHIATLRVDTLTDTLWVYGNNQAGLIALAGGTLATVANASTANGQVSLDSSAGVTTSSAQTAFAYDAGRNVAFATGVEDGSGAALQGVAVYAGGAGNPATTGLSNPDRRIVIAGATSLSLDASRDTLYVGDAQDGLWIVQQASSASPVVVGPITVAQVHSVSVDAANDRLAVGTATGARVFEHASALTAGSAVPAPSVVLSGSGDYISSAAFR